LSVRGKDCGLNPQFLPAAARGDFAVPFCFRICSIESLPVWHTGVTDDAARALPRDASASTETTAIHNETRHAGTGSAICRKPMFGGSLYRDKSAQRLA